MEPGLSRARAGLGEFAHGQFRVDYEARIDPAALRSKRVERARSAMRAHGLDAMLVWKNENVRYLSGLRAQLIAGKASLLNGCLLTSEGPPVLFASGGEVQRCQVVMPWIEEIHAVPIMEDRALVRATVEQTIAPVLRAAGLAGGRLGVDEGSFSLLQALGELDWLTLGDADGAMLSARRVKLPEELALMEEACAIAEAVTRAAIDAVRPGVRETDVVAEAMHTLFRLGGEQAHVDTPFVASGEHMSPPNRISSDKILREGDLVFVDIGAMWSGYFGDLGRTVVCGAPSHRQREVYTAVFEGLRDATAAMAPGRTTEEVAAAVRTAAGRHGLQDHFISLFIGHGVGIGSNEPPYIGETLPGAGSAVLEEGMTFAVEPLIWVPGVRGGGGVRLEDTIVVEPGGGRPLTRTGFDERLLLGDRPQ
ncbi:MAG: aminopeptidase P family protein [Candidatus Dormibacteraeota bacterium]|nr:aminopeptidase P family protein [Candidatus Dormibacteraeota bacterium]MBO0706221.1 aminopeptidase P family protein [Candidatus Dormibacteraeota bacterium]MBO0760185.1 aminopeptidase P family protein [Candidatus Dormibacteraeota bacterium]